MSRRRWQSFACAVALLVPLLGFTASLAMQPAAAVTKSDSAAKIGAPSSTADTTTTIPRNSAAVTSTTTTTTAPNPVFSILAPSLLPVCETSLFLLFVLPELEPKLAPVANVAIPLLQPLIEVCGERPQPSDTETCPDDTSLQAIVAKLPESSELSEFGISVSPEQTLLEETQAIVDTLPSADRTTAIQDLLIKTLKCVATIPFTVPTYPTSPVASTTTTTTEFPSGAGGISTSAGLSPSDYSGDVQSIEQQAQAFAPIAAAVTPTTTATASPAPAPAATPGLLSSSSDSHRGFRYPEVWLVPLALILGILLFGQAVVGSKGRSRQRESQSD